MIAFQRQVSRKKSRGCQVLAWFVAVFFVTQIALSSALDTIWAHVRFPYFFQQLDRIEQLPSGPDVVCLGSSRFGSDIEHREMTRILRARTNDATLIAFNSYAPAGDLYVNERMLRELLARNIRPRVLLVEILPESVNDRNDWFRLHVGRQVTWGEIPKYVREITQTGHLGRLLGARFLPAFHLRGELREAIGQGWLHAMTVSVPSESFTRPDLEHLPAEDWETRIRETLTSVPATPTKQTNNGVGDVIKALDRYRPGGTSASSLEAMLETCKDQGIQVYLVGAPVASAHRACYTSEIEGQFQGFLKRIHDRFGVPFLDYRDRLPDACFLDNHHANNTGAFLFTRQFTLEVLVPRFRRES